MSTEASRGNALQPHDQSIYPAATRSHQFILHAIRESTFSVGSKSRARVRFDRRPSSRCRVARMRLVRCAEKSSIGGRNPSNPSPSRTAFVKRIGGQASCSNSVQGLPVKLSAIALDYDGTIARGDVMDPSARGAIAAARTKGTTVPLVTGRMLDELRRVAGDLHFVDGVIAGNGAVIHFPDSGHTSTFAPPVSENFMADLRARALQRPRVPPAPDRRRASECRRWSLRNRARGVRFKMCSVGPIGRSFASRLTRRPIRLSWGLRDVEASRGTRASSKQTTATARASGGAHRGDWIFRNDRVELGRHWPPPVIPPFPRLPP